MDEHLLFDFKTDISGMAIPEKLNNPFGSFIPEIARIAAKELQEFIVIESQNWEHDFSIHRGKMFGVLVVQKEDLSYSYLGTFSGRLEGNTPYGKFLPSIFDDSVDDFFMNRGMTELTKMGRQIEQSTDQEEISDLREKRKLKSHGLQRQLFENYRFQNLYGLEKNVIEIFEDSLNDYPPSAAGECAAPKLLQHAFVNQLKPIALAEFWWGKPNKNKDRDHEVFYPACTKRCRPILEFMLEDAGLYRDREGESER